MRCVRKFTPATVIQEDLMNRIPISTRAALAGLALAAMAACSDDGPAGSNTSHP